MEGEDPQKAMEAILRQRQDWREERALFLDEWRQNVSSAQNDRTEAQRLGVEYAQIALRGAFLTNSGALIALPPLMSWLRIAGEASGAVAALWFVGGLLAAAISALVAYFNFMCLAAVYDARATIRSTTLFRRYYPQSYENNPLEEDKEFSKAENRENIYGILTEVTRVLAILIGLFSYSCFVAGTLSFKSLVNSEADKLVHELPAETSAGIAADAPKEDVPATTP